MVVVSPLLAQVERCALRQRHPGKVLRRDRRKCGVFQIREHLLQLRRGLGVRSHSLQHGVECSTHLADID